MRIEPLQYHEIRQFSTVAKDIIQSCKYYTPYARRAEVKKFDVNAIRNSLRKKDYVYLIAKNKGDIVGFCCGYFDAGTFWVDWIGVMENCRQKGIAIKLLKSLEIAAKRAGAHKIWCDTRITNRRAILLLNKTEFKKIGKLKKHWYRQDFYFWQKLI